MWKWVDWTFVSRALVFALILCCIGWPLSAKSYADHHHLLHSCNRLICIPIFASHFSLSLSFSLPRFAAKFYWNCLRLRVPPLSLLLFALSFCSRILIICHFGFAEFTSYFIYYLPRVFIANLAWLNDVDHVKCMRHFQFCRHINISNANKFQTSKTPHIYQFPSIARRQYRTVAYFIFLRTHAFRRTHTHTHAYTNQHGVNE